MDIFRPYLDTCMSPISDNSSIESARISQLIIEEGRYLGELKESLMCGTGIFLWNNGDSYFGEWQAHKPHGQGCFLFNDGIYIEGNFASGRVSGVAGIYYPNGSYLKGNFHCGKLKDRALFYNSEEDVWSLRDYTNKDDSTVLFEGKGNPVAYNYSSSTQGQGFRDLAMHINMNTNIDCVTAEKPKMITSPYLGCFQMDSDTRHFGYFENGKISGLGVRVSSCIIETGDYHEGELNGHGYRIEPNQLIYIGNFENGAFHGQGTLFDLAKMMKSEGEFYKGVFLHLTQQTPFTLKDLQSSTLNQGYMEPINAHFAQLFKIRSYQHLFSVSRKSSPKNSSASSVANSSRPEPEALAADKYQVTTIKEVSKAKLISKEVIISTEELPQEALHKPFLDINSHNTSVDINNLALSMQKSPENIDKAIELSTKCIEHLKNRLEKFQNVPRSKRIYIDEKETSERPFSRAFSIEVTPLSPTEKRRTKSRDAILTNPNPTRLSLQNYQSTFRVSIDELKRTSSPKIKIETLLNRESNRFNITEPEIITPIKPSVQEIPKTSELKTLPSQHSPADEMGILYSSKSEKSIGSLPSQFSVHEALKTVPNPSQLLKNLPLKNHMETCDTHDTHDDNTYDFSTKIPSRVSLHDIPDLSSSCVLKANNTTNNSRTCLTSTKDSITRSTSARNSAKAPTPLQRDINIEVTPKTGNKNGYINLAQICASTSQANRGNPLTKPLRADHLYKTPTPNEENYPSLWQNQDQTLRSSFTQAVEKEQASTKRANSTTNNAEKKPYVSPYTVTFKAKEYQNQKATSRSVTKKPQVQKPLNRTVSKEDLNASIASKRTSRSGSIQANKSTTNKSMVLNTSTASRKSSKDVIPKRNIPPAVETPVSRIIPTLESNQSSQEFTRLNDFDLETVKRDIMNGSVEHVIKVLSAKKTTPAAPTQERRSKWKIPSEDLPLQSVSSRKGLKEQDTNKSSVSSSTYNKIKNSMRSDSPVICLNLERTQNNESFVSSSETEQPKLKLLLNSQSMSRASIANISHQDIEDKRMRMSDLESSPIIRNNLQKQKENNPRKPSVTKANNNVSRVNQSMDYLRPTISSNQKKPVPAGIKHITPVKKVSPMNNSFQQQQGNHHDSDILTITSIASSQKSKSPQSKISCKFVNSIQINGVDHSQISHPNMRLEYGDTVRSSFGSQSHFNQTKTEQKVLSQFAKYSSFEIANSQRQVFTEPAAPEEEEEEEESPRLLATYGIQSHLGVNYEQNEDYEDIIASPQTPNLEKMFSFQNQSALKRANELDSVRSSKPELNNHDPVKNLPSDRKKSPGRVTTSMSSKVEFDVFKRLSDNGFQTFEALRTQNHDTKNTEPHEPITEKYEEEKEYRLDTQEFEDFVEQLQVRAQNMASKYETLIIDESQEVGDIKPISFDLKAHTLTEKPHGSTSRSRRSSKGIIEASSDLQLETESVTEPEFPKDSYQSVRIRTTEETQPRITEPDSPVFNIKENSKRLSLQSQQNSQRSHDDLIMKRRSFAQPAAIPTVTSLHETVKDLHCPPQSRNVVSTKAQSFASQGGNTSNSMREMGSVPVSLTSLLDQTSKNNFKANIDKLFQEPKVIPSKLFIHKAPQMLVNDKKGFPRTPLMYKEQQSARVSTVDLGDSSLKVNATLTKNNRSMASYSNEQEEASVLSEKNCNIGPKFMDKENLFKEKRILEDDEISDESDDIPEERPNQTTYGTTEGKYYTDERFMTGFSNEKKFSFENGALYTDNTLERDEILKIR